ncbi:MAG TPA: diphosphate--fructose-6-phosphate 1-phosphotransferase [Syntrophorhabdaceae bacterium]|nr:diphosphate--fructose-6-phosphate 1-phosphotransferase [Syntrophorhabdaceae bacterium]HQM80340.1 diphosphate--fructose-6-phosphate 1-phosphotransferase [Syntrophorhabdaceae bacterium]
MEKEKDLIGIIVGGGPAPGINGVISAATIEAINQGKKVVGLIGGFKSLFEGQMNVMPLTIEDVSRIHAAGGSILRTSRDAPDNAKAKFKTLMSTLKKIGIKYLITIGGDGTLYMANWIEREARGSVSVVHTPKTIDNDIPLPGGFSTFGFQTARHVGVYIVNNIMEDARTMGRWYFITTMGRHAGHLALGMGKAAGATISLIPEEFGNGRLSFKKVADTLTGSIIKRLSMDRDYGVAILAEGISEMFDIEELSRYEDVKKNEKGELKLSEIQLGRLLRSFVNETLRSMGIKTDIFEKKIGYELRAASPVPYDVEYTRNLGYGAVRYLLKGGTGAMIVSYEGNLKPVPFVEMIDYCTGKIKIRRVDINTETYEVARKYMIRLEKEDFESERLQKLSSAANMAPTDFKARFEYLVSGSPY